MRWGVKDKEERSCPRRLITKKWRRSNLMWIFLTQPRGSDFEACSSLSGEMCVSWMHCFRAPPASLLRFDSIMLVMITYWMNVTFKTFKSPGLLEFRLPTSLTNRLKNASKATPLPNTPWRTASNSNTSIRYLNCKILSWTNHPDTWWLICSQWLKCDFSPSPWGCRDKCQTSRTLHLKVRHRTGKPCSEPCTSTRRKSCLQVRGVTVVNFN